MQTQKAPSLDPAGWLLLLVLSILWGGSFFFNELALDSLPPLSIVTGRIVLAAILLHLMLRARGLALPGNWRAWRSLFIMGAMNNVTPFCLIAWGQTNITGGLASVLNAATPLFTLILAHIFTQDEKLSLNKMIGIILGMFGVSLTVGLTAFDGLGVKIWAQLAIVAATLAYAASAVYARRFRGMPPLSIACGQITASAVILIPLTLWLEPPWNLGNPGLQGLGAVLGLAFFSTAVAYQIYFRLIQKAGATNLQLVTLLIPFSATIMGTTVLGEAVTAGQVWGMTLISLSLLVVDGRLLRLLFKRPRPATALNYDASTGGEHD